VSPKLERNKRLKCEISENDRQGGVGNSGGAVARLGQQHESVPKVAPPMRVAVSKLPDAACTRWGLAFNVGAPLFVAFAPRCPALLSPLRWRQLPAAAGLGDPLARNPVLWRCCSDC
jgi:hypothetical protein